MKTLARPFGPRHWIVSVLAAMTLLIAPASGLAVHAASYSATTGYSSPAVVNTVIDTSTSVTAPRNLNRAVVKLEVNDGTGAVVANTSVTGVTLSTTPTSFSLSFTPASTGTYISKTSVYASGGSTLLYATTSGSVEVTAANTTTSKIFGVGLNPKVMALGDSITWGYLGSDPGVGGYRPALWSSLKSQGFTFEPVGPIQGPPNDGSVYSRHASYPGLRIRDIQIGLNRKFPSVTTLMNTYRPDVVLLHIGTNDFSTNDDLANVAARADTLIDTILALRPNAHIFVARIINSYAPVPRTDVPPYNDAVEAHVRDLAAAGKHVYTVPMDTAVSSAADFVDGVHPTQATYGRMATIWSDRLVQVNALL